MIYNTKDPVSRQDFITKVKHCLDKGYRVKLIVMSKRTIQQDRYLYLILGRFAMEYGAKVDYVKEEYFKKLVNKDLFVTEEYTDALTGKLVQRVKSTKDLSIPEMSTAIDRFRTWASQEAGIYLPMANEEAYLQSLEEELSRMEKWL